MVKHLRTYTLFFQSLFILPLVHAQANQWDWAPRETLTSEQQSQLNQYCQGTYVSQWQATTSEDTRLAADMIVRGKEGVIHLKGAAQIIQPLSTLSADTIDGVPNEYYRAKGNVALRASNQLVRSSSAYIDNSGNNATQFDNAQFLSHNSGARGEAKLLSQTQSGVVFIEEGFFTTCEPNQESWTLYGSSIKLDTNSGFGTAKHVQIRIAGLPIFYFPWLRFPIDNTRQTGFLFPVLGYSGSDGVSLSAPFYWNIASNYDATFTPQFIQEKGEGIDIEFRHLGPFGDTVYEQSTFSSNEEGEQTLFKLTSDQVFNRHIYAGLTYESNPTETKYPEINSISLGEKDHYERSIYVDLNEGNFLNKVTYLTYQTPNAATNQPFEWKPRIDSAYRLANSVVDYSITGQYTDFYDPAEDNFDGRRFVLNQDIAIELSNAWGNFTPGVLAQYRDYDLNHYTGSSASSASLEHISAYIDSSIVLERSITTNRRLWRQTLEPRLNYLNSPYKNQNAIPNFDASNTTLTYSQAFSHKRFNGNDRIGDTQQLTFGLESRLYDENNSEKWAFKAGQIFYLEDRYVSISGNSNDSSPVDSSKHSDLLTSATYSGDRYSLTSNVNYDPDSDAINLTQIVASLEPVDDVKINVSYLYSVDDAEQASLGSVLPLSQNWSMFTQYTYDFLRQDSIKEIAGLGYENCCIKVSLSYQDWLNDDKKFDRGVFLQFTLRGLSSAGRANNQSSIADTYWNQGNVGY
ncbi:LPS-assembly protein LptD [Marinomonas sp. IMCC 4694]|uniref:LPS-assembly protein LptD n=1 Tax=Marinomonas sp. IMCC 4694 TaxID=2605432 RepID=UPI0011E832DD|nr:LPS assembly protein LptD [Marinomonas sp. IMCC 4694]TYL47118.1 LPS-assembly protein LptD [Marinomonas sp. IMCC 4694]